MKKVISLIVALALLLPAVTACQLTDSEDTGTAAETAAVETTDNASATEDEATSSLDLTAIVATVGDENLTLGEVKDLFDAYIDYFTYYGYDVTSDQATLESFQDDLVNTLVQEIVINQKAVELGYTELTDEQRAELDANIKDELDSMDAYYREQATTEAASDSSIDIDERVTELILEEAVQNMGIDNPTYDDYVAYITEDYTTDYYASIMKEDMLKDVAATDDEIKLEYDSDVLSDQTTFDGDPASYKLTEETYESTLEGLPATYVPEGYSRIMDILISFDGELPEEYTSNNTQMSTLKDEYKTLAFDDAIAGTNTNAARMSEILAEYTALSDERDAMFVEYAAGAKEKADAIYAELEAGGDFASLLAENTENTDFTDYQIFSTIGMLIAGDYDCSPDWSDTVKEQFASLSVGEYSKPFSDTDGYHIIYYVSDETAGVKSLDEVKTAIGNQLTLDKQSDEWSTLTDEWMNEDTVTLYTDVYRILGTEADQ